MVAKGHSAQGSCFVEWRKPRTPKFVRCFTTFAIRKVHSLAKAEGSCLAWAEVAQPPFVQPKRLLPRRLCRLAAFSVHESQTLGQFPVKLW